MNILSQFEREALIKSLSDAPDEILIDAVRQRKDWMTGIRSSFKEVQGFIGMKTIEAPAAKYSGSETGTGGSSKKVDNDPEKVSHPTTRANKSPGASAIGKIGTRTKEELFAVLKAGRQPNHDKWGEHLKLLWSRDEVKYDGKEYYL